MGEVVAHHCAYYRNIWTKKIQNLDLAKRTINNDNNCDQDSNIQAKAKRFTQIALNQTIDEALSHIIELELHEGFLGRYIPLLESLSQNLSSRKYETHIRSSKNNHTNWLVTNAMSIEFSNLLLKYS